MITIKNNKTGEFEEHRSLTGLSTKLGFKGHAPKPQLLRYIAKHNYDIDTITEKIVVTPKQNIRYVINDKITELQDKIIEIYSKIEMTEYESAETILLSKYINQLAILKEVIN